MQPGHQHPSSNARNYEIFVLPGRCSSCQVQSNVMLPMSLKIKRSTLKKSMTAVANQPFVDRDFIYHIGGIEGTARRTETQQPFTFILSKDRASVSRKRNQTIIRPLLAGRQKVKNKKGKKTRKEYEHMYSCL